MKKSTSIFVRICTSKQKISAYKIVFLTTENLICLLQS